MKLPSSDSVRKPLLVSSVVLLILLLLALVMIVIAEVVLGGPMTKQMKSEVYQRSQSFMQSIYSETAKQSFDEYMSSPVKKSDPNMISWNRMVKYLQQDALVQVLPYKNQHDQFYKEKSSTTPNIVRYSIKLKIKLRMNGRVKPELAQMEWMKEDGTLKLLLLKVPYKVLSSRRIDYVHYGLQHYTNLVIK